MFISQNRDEGSKSVQLVTIELLNESIKDRYHESNGY